MFLVLVVFACLMFGLLDKSLLLGTSSLLGHKLLTFAATKGENARIPTAVLSSPIFYFPLHFILHCCNYLSLYVNCSKKSAAQGSYGFCDSSRVHEAKVHGCESLLVSGNPCVALQFPAVSPGNLTRLL